MRPLSRCQSIIPVVALALSFFQVVGYAQLGVVDAGFGDRSVWAREATRWAKPLQTGPVKVLFVAPEPAFLDIAELSYRLDMRVSILPLPVARGTDRERDGRSHEEDVLRRRYDAIVVAQHPDRPVPEDLARRILEKVNTGTGIVVVRYSNAPHTSIDSLLSRAAELPSAAVVTRGIHLGAFAGSNTSTEFLKLREDGKIRGAVLSFSGEAPALHCLVPYIDSDGPEGLASYEGHLALLARCIPWVAHADQGVRILAVLDASPTGPDANEIPPQLPAAFLQRSEDMSGGVPLRPYELVFDGPTPRDYTLRMQLRYPERDIRWRLTQEEHVAKGSSRIRVDVPVGLGDFFIDFWLTGRRGIVDWFTEKVHLEGWPEISDVRFSKTEVQTSDSIQISLYVRRNFFSPRDSGLYLRATDSFHRLVAEKEVTVPSAAGRMEVQLAFVDLIAPGLKVEVFSVDNRGGAVGQWHRQRAAHAWSTAQVQGLHLGSFFLAHRPGATEEINASAHAQTLANSGVNAVIADDTSAPKAAWAQIRILPGNSGVVMKRLYRADIESISRPNAATLARSLPWTALLEGFDGIDVGPAFSTVGDPLDNPAVNGDGSLSVWFSETSRSVSHLRTGFATLLTHSESVEPHANSFASLSASKKGKEPQGERRDYTFSQARILAWQADPTHDGPQELKFRFDPVLHVYNMRTGLAVGRRHRESIRLHPGDVALFSGLPYSVSRVTLDVARDTARGRRLSIRIVIKTEGALPGDHVVHVSLAPGTERRCSTTAMTLCARTAVEKRIFRSRSTTTSECTPSPHATSSRGRLEGPRWQCGISTLFRSIRPVFYFIRRCYRMSLDRQKGIRCGAYPAPTSRPISLKSSSSPSLAPSSAPRCTKRSKPGRGLDSLLRRVLVPYLATRLKPTVP